MNENPNLDLTLREIIRLHKLWLRNDREGQRADLSGLNLRWADLRDADLSGADLRWADMRKADMRGSDRD